MPDLIAERYEQLEVVGRGGEGTVLRALDHRVGAPVALKVRPLPEGPDTRARLALEADLLQNLTPHPNLPIIRDAFVDGDRAILVMTWVEGENLGTLLRRRDGGMALPAVIDVATQVAAALDHLHGHRPAIVHGDVKPANLIRTPQGRIMLVDFGGALRGTPAHSIGGTRGFRAPELSAGADPSIASDIFSLGATVYALLTGGAPRFGMRARWDRLDAAAAARVEAALRATMAIDPGRRPATATVFAASLRTPRGEAEPGPTNLPADPTRLIGRGDEIASVARRLTETPLVTLVGPGGIGKTRLAIEAARSVARTAPDGVWMVELSTADAGRIPEQIGEVLGVRESADVSPLDGLAESLRDRAALVVLDAAEGAIEAIAATVGHLLERCPDVRILATSRTPLGLPIERAITVAPLPPAGDAVELFWERAQAADPTVARSADADRLAVAICASLDGVPLAIELAAAGITDRPLQELVARIARDDDPSRDAIRRSIGWAHETLTDQERVLVRRLSIFAGGCQAADASFVCGWDRLDPSDVLPLLWRLVDRRIITAEDVGYAARYGMLDSVRTDAIRRLVAAGETEHMRDRFVAWARALAADAAAGLGSPGQAAWLARLGFEHDNLRAALGIAAELGGDHALALAADLARFWYLHGHWREGREWIERLSRDAPEGIALARALSGGGRLCEALGDYDASRATYERAVAILRDRGEERELALALPGLAYTWLSAGNPARADALYAEARALAERLDVPVALSGALLGHATVAATAERWEEAIEWAERALPIEREIGEPAGTALALTTLAGAEIPAGRHDSAAAHLEEALALRRLTGDRMGEAVTLNALGELARRAHGDTARARELFLQSLAIREELGHAAGIATMLNNLATVGDDLAEQRASFERALAIRRRLGSAPMTAFALRNLAVPIRKMGDYDEAVACGLESLEIELATGHTDGVAESLVTLSRIAGARGDEAARDGLAALEEQLRAGAVTAADAAERARALSPASGPS